MTASETKALIGKLATGKPLDEAGISTLFALLLEPSADDAQRAATLMALRVRGETVAELTGASRLLRANMVRVEAPEGAVDIVGTGGDGHNTYNVSTCAAIVTAGAGLTVAKHGNRSVSSLSGSSDVLQALGVKIDIAPDHIARAIRDVGVGFLWAPMHHPAMKVWAPARASLGIRTIFNLLGPISNPAGVTRQVVGVFDRKWVEPLAHVLGNLGSEHAWVVHGSDGMDELSTTGSSHIAELKDGSVTLFDVQPEDAGLARSSLSDLRGGDAAHNAAALRAVLAGEKSAYRDIVLLNAAAALIVGGAVANLSEGVARAAHAIDDGAAARVLAGLIAATNAA